MKQQVCKGPFICFACLVCSEIWLDEAAEEYRKLRSFATVLERFKPDALGADALLASKTFVRRVVNGSDTDSYLAYATHAKMNTLPNGRVFRVAAAALARPVDQRLRAHSAACSAFSYKIQESYTFLALLSLFF